MRAQKVKRIVAERLGLRVTGILDTGKGYNSRVFFLKTNGPEFVLKVQKKKLHRHATEVWALNLLRKRGIPVPKVLAVDFKNHFIVEEKIDGITLQGARMRAEEKRGIVRRIGHYVRMMHEIKTRGYGYFKSPGVGGRRTWRANMDTHFYNNLKAVKMGGVVSNDLLERMKSFYKRHSGILNLKDPRFLHGDLRFENFIVKDSEFRSFIDLGQAWSGDPLSELAIIYTEFFREDRNNRAGLIKSFEEGYGKRADMKRMAIYLIDIWVWDLRMYGLIKKNRSEVSRIVDMIERLLDTDA